MSVILPFYDDEETIGDAVQSVLHQTWSDLELIAVDDGSTDRSAEIVAELARADERIEHLRQANQGVGAARNAGVRAARGRFCAFLDADDVWLSQKLDRQLPLLDDRAVVFTDAWVEHDSRRYPWRSLLHRENDYPRGDVSDDLIAGNFICISSVLAPWARLREAGGFREDPHGVEDYDLWLRLATAGVHFDYVPEPLVIYRVRPGSLSDDRVTMYAGEVRLLNRHRRRVTWARRRMLARRIRTARRGLAISLRRRAWRSALAGDTRAARRDLVAGFRADPTSPKALVGLVLAATPVRLSVLARYQVSSPSAGRIS